MERERFIELFKKKLTSSVTEDENKEYLILLENLSTEFKMSKHDFVNKILDIIYLD